MNHLAPFELISTRDRKLLMRVNLSLLAVFIIIAYFMPVMPDYDTYQSIYETGGGHLAYFGRDPGFILLIDILNPIFSYVQFRWFTLIFCISVIIVALWRLQGFLPSQLGFTIALALSPIIAIKFGAQIREGISICLLLGLILGRNEKQSIISFILIATFASSLHAATAPLWILLALGLYIYPTWPQAARIAGIAIYGTFVFLVSGLSRYDGDMGVGLSRESINPDVYTLMYWLCYPALFVIAHTSQRLRISSDLFQQHQIKTMAFVTSCAMLGWLFGLTLQVGLNGSALLLKGVIGDTMRLGHLLLSLYCVLLVICERRLIGALISIVLLVDTIRILTAA